MKDDSNINDNTPKKSKIQRAQTLMTNSFRMAASVLGTNNAASRKAITLTVPNLEIKDKQSYKKQPQCQICFMSFGKFGQHHCRICANAVCSSCSYSTINKERACDKCAYHYSDPKRERFKQDSLNNLTNLCVQYLSNKFKAEKDLKYLQEEIPNEQQRAQEKRTNDERIRKLNEKLEQVSEAKRALQEQIKMIKNG